MGMVRSRRGKKGTLFVNNTKYRTDNSGNYDLGLCRDCETYSLKDKLMAKTREKDISESSH